MILVMTRRITRSRRQCVEYFRFDNIQYVYIYIYIHLCTYTSINNFRYGRTPIWPNRRGIVVVYLTSTVDDVDIQNIADIMKRWSYERVCAHSCLLFNLTGIQTSHTHYGLERR